MAYRFFAHTRWRPDQLGLVLCDLIIRLLVPTGALLVAVDDTLWRRSGRRLHGAAWHHDGNGPGRHRPAWGHRWVGATGEQTDFHDQPARAASAMDALDAHFTQTLTARQGARA